MTDELKRLADIFGPREWWYVQGGDGKRVTEHRRFRTIEEVQAWAENNGHAATYYQVQVSSEESDTRPSFDEIETIVAFPIDIDPVSETRPSTEAERSPCFEVAKKISERFESLGLGRPATGDSGNGAQLFLRLKVDVTEQKQKVYWYDLFRRVQAWMKKEFSDPRVQIDSVADFARIMALPGSEKKKVIGTDGPSKERPFRKVRFLDDGAPCDAPAFEAFASGLPMVETPANEEKEFKIVELSDEILRELPPKAEALIRSWEEPTTDQSEVAFAVASELYAHGWNLDIVNTILYELYIKHPKESKRLRAAELSGRALRAAMIPTNERIREAYLHAPKRKEETPTASLLLKRARDNGNGNSGVIRVRFEKPVLPYGIPDVTLGPLSDSYPLTDVGNGERMTERFGRFLRYTAEKGWMVFKENRYTPDPKESEVGKLASVSARLIPIHETLEKEADERKQIALHAKNSESTSRINNAVTEFGRRVSASITDFDLNPSLFNVKNGTLVIEGDRIYKKEHDPDDLLTRVAGTYYDPNAKAPKWTAFLEKNIPDPEVREWLRRYCGSMLYGKNKDKAFAIVWGKKDTGKTVFKEVVLGVLGEYGGVTNWKTFEDQNDDLAKRELARIRGMRGVFAAESRKNMPLNVELIKELTGMDTISAREIYKIAFQYKPSFKLLLVGNHLPKITDEDDAIWGRIQVVPFTVIIQKSEQVANYYEVLLKEEGPGILNWLLGGLVEWMRNGLPPAKKIAEATHRLEKENNPLLQFAEERCDLGPDLWMDFPTINLAYAQWAVETGSQPFDNKTAMGRRILAIPGVNAQKDTLGNRIYTGIALKSRSNYPEKRTVRETVRHEGNEPVPDSSGRILADSSINLPREGTLLKNHPELSGVQSPREEMSKNVHRKFKLETEDDDG